MEIFYVHSDIRKFIDLLDDSTALQIERAVQLLSLETYNLRMPFSEKIEKDLYELRIAGKKNIRIFYTFYSETIYLLHIIEKKTQKLSLKDMKTARNRLNYLQLK